MMESGNASEGNSTMGSSSNASDGSAQTPYPLLMALATLVLSVAGLVGNLLIVLAMLRSRKLQNKCSALIGALAATDCIICAYLTQLRVIILLDGDSSKWTNAQCLTVSVHGIFGLSVQSGLGLAIGIDRLLAIRLPHLYNKWPACTYLTALSTPILAYATLLTLFAFRESTETPVWVCMPPTAYSGKARQLWVASNIVIVLFVLITYGLAHHIVRRKVNSGIAVSNGSRRLLTSLTLVIAVYASTWAFTVLALFTVQIVRVGPYWGRQVELQMGWLVIINSSCNVLIYAWRGKDYRRALISVITCSAESPQSSIGTSDHGFFFRRQKRIAQFVPISSANGSAATPL